MKDPRIRYSGGNERSIVVHNPRYQEVTLQQHSEPPCPASETPEYCNNDQERHKKKTAQNTTEKNAAAKLKHNILKPCGSRCCRKCCSKISEKQRVSLHKAFWERGRTWLSGHIKTLPVKKECPNEINTDL